jgi:CHASE2 domain-containing sensor protein/nitrogen-specific signal transduction histidine kinase
MKPEPPNRHLQRWQRISLTALLVSAAVIGLQQAGALRFLEAAALDQFLRHRPLEAHDPRIVLVTIEEADLTRLRQPTLSDAVLAQVLQQIKQQQPRVIGLDLYRDLPVEPGHSDLTAVFGSTPHLVGVQKAVGGEAGTTVAPPPVLAELGQVSASDVIVDEDGIVRRILLSLRDAEDQVILGFAAKITLDYLQTDGIQLEAIHPDRQHLRLGKAEFLPLQPNAGGYVRADVGGYQILSNFRRFRQDFTRISIAQLLHGQIAPDGMRDRIVLIGSTAASSNDRLHTPLHDQQATLPGTPGVVVHANFISQLLSAAIEGRPLLRTWAEPWEAGWTLVVAIGGSMLGWMLRSPQKTAVVTAIASSGLGLIAYLLFLQGWWVPLIPPIVALVTAAILSKSFDLWHSLLRSNQYLEEYALTLEQKVADRTQELREKNQLLQQEIHQHQQTEIALQKARDAAEAASRAKSRFLATMSHELRTPLSTILGYAQLMLMDDTLDVDQTESLNIINTSGEHLLELLNDVLTMSKIEAGRTTLHLTCFSLPSLLDVMVQMFRYRVEPNGVQLTLMPQSGLPEFVIADEGKLRQVLINLLGNAVKFTQQGSITLRVALQSAPEQQEIASSSDRLHFEVEDTGPGIAEAELGKLFQPFEQTETGRQSNQGTGLGLAICREFVQLMGGEISVSSQVAQGTVFRFDVPVQLAEINNFLDETGSGASTQRNSSR